MAMRDLMHTGGSSKYLYSREWEPDFSLSEKGTMNMERKKPRINPGVLDQNWT